MPKMIAASIAAISSPERMYVPVLLRMAAVSLDLAAAIDCFFPHVTATMAGRSALAEPGPAANRHGAVGSEPVDKSRSEQDGNKPAKPHVAEEAH